jgi:hypothetical protein
MRASSGPHTSRTVGTSVPAGAFALRKEARIIESTLTMVVLLFLILWITRR